MKNKSGFTLMEIMVVVVLIAFLAMLAVPNLMRFLAKGKRTEAYVTLESIYTAEKMHWAEHGAYSSDLTGPGSIGWKPEGKLHYTYGFAGQPGKNYIQGTLSASLDALNKSRADKTGFVAVAIADIDGDGKSDVITINDKHEVAIVQDDINS